MKFKLANNQYRVWIISSCIMCNKLNAFWRKMQLWEFINNFKYWNRNCHTLWTLQSLIICIFHYFMGLICTASTFTASNIDFVETSNKSQNRSEDYFRRDLKHTLWISIQPPLKTLSVQAQMDCYGNRIPNTRFVTKKNVNYWWTQSCLSWTPSYSNTKPYG